MASSHSKKTRETEEKNKSKAKETKPTKPEQNKKKRKKPNTSSKKPNISNNKNNTDIGNGAVNESESEFSVIPAPSGDSSPEESDNKLEVRSQGKAANEQTKSKRPGKISKKKEQDDEEDEKDDAKVCNFPMTRIKRIIKSQSSDCSITGDAVFLVNKATEKFVEQFCEDAYACCAEDRKKAVAYKYLASVVSKRKRYDFLSDFVPVKTKAEDALAQMKSAETGEG